MGRRLVTSNLISLAQLAVDSGGRFTENTNDLSLGYARAQRDSTCAYTLGFYHSGIVEDKIQEVSIHVRRPGLRVMHPNKYVFRSKSARRESLLQSAWFSPESFATGIVQAHAFPIRPVSKKEWDTMLAISFPVPLEDLAEGEQTREFGAVMYEGGKVVGQFGRRLTVRPQNLDAEGTPRITMIERTRLKPGPYSLTVVLSDPNESDPDATKVTVTVPEIPRKELFIVGPILARQSGANLTVLGNPDGEDRAGAMNTFEPLMVLQHDGSQDLLALTQACMVGGRGAPSQAKIGRELFGSDDGAIGNLSAVPLALEGEGKIRCQSLLDVVPADTLGGGEYAFQASIESEKARDSAEQRVRFAISENE